jgi:hypothetical protein
MDRVGLAMVYSPGDLGHQASEREVIGVSDQLLVGRIGCHCSLLLSR